MSVSRKTNDTAVLRRKRRQEVENARRGFVTASIKGIGIRNERLTRKRLRGRVARVWFDTRLRTAAFPLGKTFRCYETNYAESERRKRAAARNKDVEPGWFLREIFLSKYLRASSFFVFLPSFSCAFELCWNTAMTYLL